MESKGFALMYDGNKRMLARRSEGAIAFVIALDSNVLYMETSATRGRHSAVDAIMAALEAHATEGNAEDVNEASLLH